MSTALQGVRVVLRPSGGLEGGRVALFEAALAKAFGVGGEVAVDLSSVETLSPEAMDALQAAMEQRADRLMLIVTGPGARVPRAVDFDKVQMYLELAGTHDAKTDRAVKIGAGKGSWRFGG